MFSITTAEVRWFKKGKIPEAMHNWIRSGEGECEEQSPRTDVYFLPDDTPSLGIKVRESRMEIKKRLSSEGCINHSSLSGIPETWTKWSTKTDGQLSENHPLFLDGDHWVQVLKIRSIKKFEISHALELVPFPTDQYPQAGIAIELSNLEIDKELWWTFGLETFGRPDQVMVNLSKIFPTLLKGMPSIKLTQEQSMAYPEWINIARKKP